MGSFLEELENCPQMGSDIQNGTNYSGMLHVIVVAIVFVVVAQVQPIVVCGRRPER